MKITDETETYKKQNKAKQKKTNKDRKEQGVRETIMKGWELNDFVAHLS